ncbi:MAG: ATP-binding protein [Planctomycetota bacterium]
MWQTLALGISIGAGAAGLLCWLWTLRLKRRVREAEASAAADQRLAELGTLTGGLAHEIKNPLSTLGLNAQLIEEDLAELAAQLDEPGAAAVGRCQRRFGMLQRELVRLRDVLEDFLRFAGRLELDPQAQDINPMLDELSVFFEPQALAAGVTLRLDLGSDVPRASVDAPLLKQAVLNLMLNAVQAMQRVTAERQAAQKARGGLDAGQTTAPLELILRTRREGRPGKDDRVVILVADTGPGMASEVAQRVFQPYFSTRRGGTGLGLATTRRIIEAHGGALELHTEPGLGAEFRIVLPPVAPGAPDAG